MAVLTSVGQPSRLETQQEQMLGSWVRTPQGQLAGWKLRHDFYVVVLRQNFFFSRNFQFLLLRPSAGWMRPTHRMEGNFLYLKSINCAFSSHLQNIVTTCRIVLGQATGRHSLSKLTHEISHHTGSGFRGSIYPVIPESTAQGAPYTLVLAASRAPLRQGEQVPLLWHQCFLLGSLLKDLPSLFSS